MVFMKNSPLRHRSWLLHHKILYFEYYYHIIAFIAIVYDVVVLIFFFLMATIAKSHVKRLRSLNKTLNGIRTYVQCAHSRRS